jgi:hypothetical protein
VAGGGLSRLITDDKKRRICEVYIRHFVSFLTVEVSMVASPVTAMLVALVTLCASTETAAAKAAQSRHPTASHSLPSRGQTMLRKQLPITNSPTQDEKAWMERASVPNNGAGGGGM